MLALWMRHDRDFWRFSRVVPSLVRRLAGFLSDNIGDKKPIRIGYEAEGKHCKLELFSAPYLLFCILPPLYLLFPSPDSLLPVLSPV